MELPRKKTDISQTLALMWEIFDGFTYAVLSGNGAVYITLELIDAAAHRSARPSSH
jgi:hypothetical protein